VAGRDACERPSVEGIELEVADVNDVVALDDRVDAAPLFPHGFTPLAPATRLPPPVSTISVGA